MEVETRPPVDGKLGYMSSQESELRLVLTDNELHSDEERELRPPTDERLTQTKVNPIINSSNKTKDKSLPNPPVVQKCSAVEVVSNVSDNVQCEAEVFRTECDQPVSEQNEIVRCLGNDEKETATSRDPALLSGSCGSPNAPGLGKDNVVAVEEDSLPVTGKVASDIIVEEPGDIDLEGIGSSEKISCDNRSHKGASESVKDSSNIAESHCGDSAGNISDDDAGSSDCPVLLGATTLPVALEELNVIEQNAESPVQDEIYEAADGSDATVRDGLNGVLDEADDEVLSTGEELVLAVSESEENPTTAVSGVIDDHAPAVKKNVRNGSKASEDDRATNGDEVMDHGGEEGSKETADDGSESKEPAEDEIDDKELAEGDESVGPDLQDDNTMDHMIPRDPMDDDQDDGDGTPEYQGMTDDILPIIESELDDQPPEGEGVFDTEVEDGAGGLDEVDEAQNRADSVDIGDEISRGGEEFDDGITIDEPEREEDSTKKIVDKFSSEGREKLKRRVSLDSGTPAEPPEKKLKKQSSLDDLNECSAGFDAEQFMNEVKSAGKKLEVAEKPAGTDSDSVLELKTPVKDVVTKLSVSPSEYSGLMCIDLDDVDTKPAEGIPELKTDVKDEIKFKEEEYSPRDEKFTSGPALDALFSGKKEITMSRKTFTRILKSYVSQYVMNLGGIGKATRLSLKGEDAINKMNAGITSYEKQRDDYKAIVKKLIEDREASKQWDETLIPPKMTRSVGLQVCTVGGINVRDAANQPTQPTRNLAPRNVLPNPNVALMAQKQAYAMQQKAQAEQLMKRKAKQLENHLPNRPTATAKKSTGGSPRQLNNLNSALGIPPAPRLNGLSNSSPVNRSPVMMNRNVSNQVVQQQVSKPPNAVVSPSSKTIMIGGKQVTVNTPVKTQQVKTNLNPMLAKALGTQPQRVPTSVVGAQRQIPNSTNQQQANRNLASGPGRPPPVKPQNVVGNSGTPQKRTSGSSEATIDLTDDDGPQKMLNQGLKRPVQPSPGSNTKMVLNRNMPMKQVKHPPLPANPPPLSPRQLPPRPYLGICNAQEGAQGIMLTWHFNGVLPPRKINKFQVYAYQESKSTTSDETWKKVGDVDALPLPMACTLTQFREGYTYHFIVRAVDDVNTIGPFSAPNTITLVKKITNPTR